MVLYATLCYFMLILRYFMLLYAIFCNFTLFYALRCFGEGLGGSWGDFRKFLDGFWKESVGSKSLGFYFKSFGFSLKSIGYNLSCKSCS